MSEPTKIESGDNEIDPENKKALPKYLTFSDDVFNMIWTMGFNSGARIENEVVEGLITQRYELDKRVKEMINKDAEEINVMLKLRKDMLS